MTAPSRPDDDRIAEIMVVCTANICRSPLAAAMLEQEARQRLGPEPSLWVRSSGVHALEGHTAASGSLAEAEKRGLDLSHHRGAPTTRADVERSDLVLTMTESHRSAVNQRAPGSGGKVFTLREFARLAAALKPLEEGRALRDRVRFLVRLAHGARSHVARPAEPEDVADPYGGPDEGYRRMAAEIETLVGEIAPQLFGSEPPDAQPGHRN
ncbi:MAG: hypothetical protein R3343_02900 [Nitriliruptorales bacterium]|nr:hypothetical protein [Nitriliruptorales bacterium]